METLQSNRRSSNLELLRIIAMLAIVAHHYVLHGHFSASTVIFEKNKYILDALGSLGKVGTFLFVLITGYFRVNKPASFKTVLKFEAQILFYSMFAYIAALVLNIETDLFTSVFPLSSSAYWFATCFFLILILSPVLNLFLQKAGKRTFEIFLVLFITAEFIIPLFTGLKGFCDQLYSLMVCYLTGGYIRLYSKDDTSGCRGYLLRALLIWFASVLYIWVNDYLAITTGNTEYFSAGNALFSENSIVTFLLSVYLFQFFRVLEVPYSPLINKLAKASFGVYLLHDNNFIKVLIWRDIFHCSDYSESPLMVMHAAIAIFSVYIGGTVIELLRQQTLGRLCDGLIDKVPGTAIKKLEDAAVVLLKKIKLFY